MLCQRYFRHFGSDSVISRLNEICLDQNRSFSFKRDLSYSIRRSFVQTRSFSFKQETNRTTCYLVQMRCYLVHTRFYLVRTRCYTYRTRCYLVEMRCYLVHTRFYLLRTRCYLVKTRCYLIQTRQKICAMGPFFSSVNMSTSYLAFCVSSLRLPDNNISNIRL